MVIILFKARFSLKFLLILSVFLSFSLSAQEIALKPGQYKITTTFWLNGKAQNPVADLQAQFASNPAMKQMMDQMSPKDREQMMKNLKAASSKDNSMLEHCIKKEDLNADNILKGMDGQDDCTHTITKKTTTEVASTISCTSGNKGITYFEAIGNDKFSFEFNGTFHGSEKARISSQGHFVSATCKK